ncbi:MAG: DUF2508 family protein [Clostridiaceae bacterium]
MNKKNILSFLVSNKGSIGNVETTGDIYFSKENLITAIKDAENELRFCDEYFDNVKDDRLLEYAIYKGKAAKSRYEYLINIAKEKGVQHSEYINDKKTYGA